MVTTTKSTTTTTPTTKPGSRRSTAAAGTFKLVKFQTRISGKPDEDAEAHVLCSNNLMNTHHFVDGVKIQRFSLTLLGEARL